MALAPLLGDGSMDRAAGTRAESCLCTIATRDCCRRLRRLGRTGERVEVPIRRCCVSKKVLDLAVSCGRRIGISPVDVADVA